MRLRHCAAPIATLLLACAAHEASTPKAAVPMLSTDSRAAELLDAEAALEASLLTTPDCPAAHEHLRALCALAEAICVEARGSAREQNTEMLRDPPPPSEPDPRCADARARCGRAQKRVKELCPRAD